MGHHQVCPTKEVFDYHSIAGMIDKSADHSTILR